MYITLSISLHIITFILFYNHNLSQEVTDSQSLSFDNSFNLQGSVGKEMMKRNHRALIKFERKQIQVSQAVDHKNNQQNKKQINKHQIRKQINKNQQKLRQDLAFFAKGQSPLPKQKRICEDRKASEEKQSWSGDQPGEDPAKKAGERTESNNKGDKIAMPKYLKNNRIIDKIKPKLLAALIAKSPLINVKEILQNDTANDIIGNNAASIPPPSKIFAQVLKVQAESMKKKHHNNSTQHQLALKHPSKNRQPKINNFNQDSNFLESIHHSQDNYHPDFFVSDGLQAQDFSIFLDNRNQYRQSSLFDHSSQFTQNIFKVAERRDQRIPEHRKQQFIRLPSNCFENERQIFNDRNARSEYHSDYYENIGQQGQYAEYIEPYQALSTVIEEEPNYYHNNSFKSQSDRHTQLIRSEYDFYPRQDYGGEIYRYY